MSQDQTAVQKKRAWMDILNESKPFLALAALLAVCTAFLVDGSFNPFLYFRF